MSTNQMIAEQSPDKIYRYGMKLLMNNLGAKGTVKFLQYFTRDEDRDYTRDKYLRQDMKPLDEIFAEMEQAELNRRAALNEMISGEMNKGDE